MTSDRHDIPTPQLAYHTTSSRNPNRIPIKMTQQQQKNRTLPIIVMFFLFAMISFVTNLAAPMGTIWKGEYPAPA